MRITKIYALVNPNDTRVFYIGQTSMRLSRRLWEHVTHAPMRRSVKEKYIADLLVSGVKPQILELAVLNNPSEQEVIQTEQAWIDFYRTQGCELTNSYPAAFSRHENHRIRWTPELDALLGQLPDKEIAEQMGCTRESVTYRREKLGIPRCPQQNFGGVVGKMGGWNKKVLAPDIIEMLGKMPDYRLAELAGVSKAAIAHARKERGILSYGEATGNDGKVKLGDVPKRWRDRSFVVSSSSDLPDEIVSQLGKVPDSELAVKVGVTFGTIARWRRNLGIPSHRSTLSNLGR
jgi:hypothetical protein